MSSCMEFEVTFKQLGRLKAQEYTKSTIGNVRWMPSCLFRKVRISEGVRIVIRVRLLERRLYSHEIIVTASDHENLQSLHI